MKRFTTTKFFLSLQEASQKGVDIDAQVLKNDYDEFTMLLFSQGAVLSDKTAYYHSLVYTRVELAGLTKVSGGKCDHISEKSHRTCR